MTTTPINVAAVQAAAERADKTDEDFALLADACESLDADQVIYVLKEWVRTSVAENARLTALLPKAYEAGYIDADNGLDDDFDGWLQEVELVEDD